MDIESEEKHADDHKQEKSVIKLTAIKPKYVFKPVQSMKLSKIYDEIRKSELEENEETMFPNNFKEIHSEELQTYLFEIQVVDEYKKWNIMKKLSELITLKNALREKFPHEHSVFEFPAPEETEIDHFIAGSILQLFCTFLNSVSKSLEIVESKEFLLFIENWVSNDKKKMVTYLQRNLLKKAGGRHTDSSWTRIMNNFISWRPKFFTVTNEGVYYTDSDESFSIKEMLLFNQSFSLLHGEIKTGYTYGLILNSSHRVLQVDAENVENFLLFIYSIKQIIHKNCEPEMNRFNSFSKVRENCNSVFYVDGKDYFEGLYFELMKAKKEIFITGWFLTPHMYLIQKYEDVEQYRIDKIFQKLAIKGVKIYIIVYNAPRIAIDINPEFTETYLTSLHENIKVLRHPFYMFIPFLWSHHEKIVIIDHKVAFMGGFDIGYGRMDDNFHALADEEEKVWRGIDYCNYRISDLTQIHVHEVCSIDRQSQVRMPWHDIGVKIVGKSVNDLCRHFVQYWNHANYQLYMTERELMMYTGIHEEEFDTNEVGKVDDMNEEIHEIIQKHNVDNTEIEKTFEIEKDVSLSEHLKVEEDFYPNKNNESHTNILSTTPEISPNKENFLFASYDITKIKKSHINREFMKPEKYFKNNNNSKFLSFFDSSPIYRQEPNQEPELKKLRSSEYIVSHENAKETEIEYYLNYLKNEKNKNPRSFESFHQEKIEGQTEKVKEKKPELILTDNVTSNEIISPLKDNSLSTRAREESTIKESQHKHQILRSASLWSLGLKEGHEEKSILEGYLSLIENSKHFIYIENQFFISFESGIKEKIAERILKAHAEKEIFKVMIVLPFLPGFPGEVDNDSSAVFRVQLDLVYKTICRGENSLIGLLSEVGNLEDYLSIYCLRNHGKINGLPATEIVYVHSKLMIVDDSVILIGSANINDRSLIGDRDSEIGLIVEDSEEVEIGNEKTNGLPKIKVKKLAHELRKKLYMEHFAIKSEEAEHFFNFKIWDEIQFTAERNQKIYRKLFGCYPDDGIKNFSDLAKLREEAEPERYEELKLLIKGYACPFQTEFLEDESLELHSGQKEYYIPFINFT